MQNTIYSPHNLEYLLLKNRSNMYKHGDKAGEILSRQLKSTRAKQTIKCVKSQHGRVPTDQQGISDAFQKYYKE